MATIEVKGKKIFLDDKIVQAGDDVIRAALAASFPDAATMDFEVVSQQQAAHVTERAPAIITSRSMRSTYATPEEVARVIKKPVSYVLAQPTA